MVSLEEQAKEEGPKLEDRMRQTGFYHSKSREYDNQLESLEVTNMYLALITVAECLNISDN